MSEKGSGANAPAEHLHAAIERVREDIRKVEFWADAVTGFSQPVPDYASDDARVWVPSEQAAAIPSTGQDKLGDEKADPEKSGPAEDGQ